MPVEPTAGSPQPKEALAFWKGKARLSAGEYRALEDQAKARAFAVSGLSRLDQVEAVHNALTKALEEGETFRDFKARIGSILEEKGWVGEKAWRVPNIYRTNLQSAYQAGRYAQMKETATSRPYWRYLAVKDSRTRRSHLALHGKVYPHDHEFWDTWYPPNGFQCRCTVQTLSERQVKARGFQVETKIPTMGEPLDPRIGGRLPAVPLRPDPGWSGNVGRDWLSGLAPRELEGKLEPLSIKAICRESKGLFTEGAACKPPLAGLDRRHIHVVKAGDILPKGLKDEEYVRAFLKEFGMGDINGSVVHRLPGGIPVVVGKELFLDKATGVWKVAKKGREQYVHLLARTIKDPYEVWMVPAGLSGRPMTVLRLIRLFSVPDGDVGGFAVFNLTGRGWSGATAFTPNHLKTESMIRYLEKQREGTLLFREP